jgi:hypothetical protein
LVPTGQTAFTQNFEGGTFVAEPWEWIYVLAKHSCRNATSTPVGSEDRAFKQREIIILWP